LFYSCPSPVPRLRSSLLFCAVILNCSSRPVLRINLIAAVAPCSVPRTSFKSLLSFSNSSFLLSVYRGQDKRTYRTLIVLWSHIQRLVLNLGTLLSYRNSLKPILPMRSWVSNTLYAFARPTYSLRFILPGSSTIFRRWYLFIFYSYLFFYFSFSSSFITFYALSV
jgi:hypothetical protein